MFMFKDVSRRGVGLNALIQVGTDRILIIIGENIRPCELTDHFSLSDEEEPEPSVLADAESLSGFGPATPRRLQHLPAVPG